MPVLHISGEMVYLKLSKLKTDKSSGPDMVHPRILKELNTHLTLGYRTPGQGSPGDPGFSFLLLFSKW